MTIMVCLLHLPEVELINYNATDVFTVVFYGLHTFMHSHLLHNASNSFFIMYFYAMYAQYKLFSLFWLLHALAHAYFFFQCLL